MACFRVNAQQVFINEIQSSNDSVFADYESAFPDWIELYNNSGVAINLNSYFLSDDSLNLYKWKFPNVVIDSAAYLIVWASKKDSVFPTHEIHTNFKLRAAGEQLFLSAPDSSLLDSVIIPPLRDNESFGRQPDGFSDWFYFNSSSPDSSNNFSSSMLISLQDTIYK